MEVTQLRLGVVVPGCAELRDGGVAATSRVAPLVEMLAELVASTTVLGYDPPKTGAVIEDRTDFVMRPAGGRMKLVSLGPRGSFRDYFARRRRVRAIAAAESAQWDLVFLPLTNRRVGLVYGALRCDRVVAQIGGHTPNVAKVRSEVPLATRVVSMITSNISARQYRKIARNSLFYVNGEALIPIYEGVNPDVAIVRTSVRRASQSYTRGDRMTDGNIRIGIVSRLTPAKGVMDVIEAFALVRSRTLPNATLHVVGEGDAQQDMQRRVEELGLAEAVTWYGWVPPGDELFAIYRQLDVLVTLSLAESLPNTVGESLANSVLVVATPVGALPHAFTDGEDLLFVPTNDAAAAADAIERLAADPELRRRLLRRGRETAAQQSVEAIAQQLLDGALARWPELRDRGRG